MAEKVVDKSNLIPYVVAGVGPRVKEQLDLTETTQDVLGEEGIFLSTDIIGASTKAALLAANAWLEETAEIQTNNETDIQHE